MICQSCKRKKAVLHSYCISSNELIDMHYCEECGKKQPVEEGVCFDDSLHNLLDGLLESRKREVVLESAAACEFCGTTLKDIRRHTNLGCPNCYELFAEHLHSLRSLPDREHRKTVPFDDALPGIHILRKELEEAVRHEDFEKAASIRDKILDCEKEGFLSDN
jgi:protein arginine kinase activator